MPWLLVTSLPHLCHFLLLILSLKQHYVHWIIVEEEKRSNRGHALRYILIYLTLNLFYQCEEPYNLISQCDCPKKDWEFEKKLSLGALINYIEPHLVTLFVLNVTAVCEAITDSGELQSFLNQRWQMIENGAIHTVCLYLYFSFLLPLISLPSLTCSHSQTHSLPPSCWFMVTVKGHERLA